MSESSAPADVPAAPLVRLRDSRCGWRPAAPAAA